MYRKTTKILLILVTSILIIWNISMLFVDETGHYISNVIRDYSWRFQTIPIFFGVLIGHWFTGIRGLELKSRFVWLFPIGVVAITFDCFNLIIDCPPIIPFLIGILIGWFFWSMSVPPEREK